MENIDVPEYFICPISLQIMKDPVTAVSGITYDRDSIEEWLFKNHNAICPVTKQVLPGNSNLTPNHTLRRLIQAWCTVNAPYGVDRIPTPKTPLSKFYVINLVRDLSKPNLQLKTLQKLEALAVENDRNRVHMVEAGLAKSLITCILSCCRKGVTSGLEEALSILYLIRFPLSQSEGALITANNEIINALMSILEPDFLRDITAVKFHAAYALKTIIRKGNPSMLERLKPEFFRIMAYNIRQGSISHQGTNALLHILLEACPWGRNRAMMVESGTVFDLIEVELRSPEKKTTELVLGIIYHLCSCADGRAQLLSHAAGIAVVTRQILKVTPTADDRAVLIIWQICKYSATSGILQEMLRVGTVAKLCMLMQANSAPHLKEKAREILRMHSDVWKESPCAEVASVTTQFKVA